MSKQFKGLFTAIITPFDAQGKIDEAALRELIDFQISNKVDGLVPCGTTGESPTLTDEEKLRVIRITLEQSKKQVQVIAGTGSNNTRHTLKLTQEAKNLGADGALLVNPYYSKPTQKGLYLHFKAIAHGVDLPCVVYNIKGRTAVNVETDTLIRLTQDCSNIVAVKEASGDLNQMKEVIARAHASFSVLSGDDNMTLPLIKAGGDGIVSVAANLVPDRMAKMVQLALAGQWDEAEANNSALTPLYRAEFIETNPIPIKTMLALTGRCQEQFRLPICSLEKEEHRELLKTVLKELNLFA